MNDKPSFWCSLGLVMALSLSPIVLTVSAVADESASEEKRGFGGFLNKMKDKAAAASTGVRNRLDKDKNTESSAEPTAEQATAQAPTEAKPKNPFGSLFKKSNSESSTATKPKNPLSAFGKMLNLPGSDDEADEQPEQNPAMALQRMMQGESLQDQAQQMAMLEACKQQAASKATVDANGTPEQVATQQQELQQQKGLLQQQALAQQQALSQMMAMTGHDDAEAAAGQAPSAEQTAKQKQAIEQMMAMAQQQQQAMAGLSASEQQQMMLSQTSALTGDVDCETLLAQEGNRVSGRNVVYAGYSKKFKDIKSLVAQGNVEQAYQQHLTRLEKTSKRRSRDEDSTAPPEYKDPNFLFTLEQGLMALDAGQRDDATQYFEQSERLLEQREEKRGLGSVFKKVGTKGVNLLGFGEVGTYRGEAFERILMLNYKSIAYMLNGDRRAYNVTRRAINWQNTEKRDFDQEMQEVREKAAEKALALQAKAAEKEAEQAEESEVAEEATGGGDKTATGDESDSETVAEAVASDTEIADEEVASAEAEDDGTQGLFEVIQKQYEASKSKALQVPNAFVNPFGFYMAGIVQEFDSYEDRSLRDNARISYQKALELKPDSAVIKQALKAIDAPAPKGKRLVHIVVAEGFAPEKKVLNFNYEVAGTPVEVKLPIYETDDSSVGRIEVQDGNGKVLSTLSQIADIDAITMRYQYDSLGKQHLNLILSITRTIYENRALGGMGLMGSVIKMGKEAITNPDMRSWMTLPKQMLAARLFLPKGVDSLQLVVFDKENAELSRKAISLNTENHNFIYARSTEKTLYTSNSEELWALLK